MKLDSNSPTVLMVASYFPPRQAAGVFRSKRFCKYLPEYGWNVHVLTVSPAAYEAGSKIDHQLLLGLPDSVTVHPAYAVYPLEWIARVKRLFGCSSSSGSTRRTDTPSSSMHRNAPPQPSSLWQRTKDAVTLPLMTPDISIGWIPFAVRRGQQLFRRTGFDVIYSSGPPWSNHLVGYRLHRSTQRPWVADFRDPWVNADFQRVRMTDSWVGRSHQRWERRVVESADHIIVNTNGSLQDFIARYGSSVAHKFTLIPNGFDPADFEDIVRPSTAIEKDVSVYVAASAAPSTGHSCAAVYQSHASAKQEVGPETQFLDEAEVEAIAADGNTPGKLVLAHAGSFYGRRSIGSLIEAVGNLLRSGQISPDHFEIRLIGAIRSDSDHGIMQQLKQYGATPAFVLTNTLPHKACLQALNEATVLLLVQVGAPISIPGKVFEYIALGKTIFTLASAGATSDLVRQERLGPCVDPDDVRGIESALLRLCDDFLRHQLVSRVNENVRNRYDGRSLTGTLNDILRNVLQQHATSPR